MNEIIIISNKQKMILKLDMVTYTLEEEEVVLICMVNTNPKVNIHLSVNIFCLEDLTFWWEKKNDTLSDQNSNETKSEVTLKLLNESLGIGRKKVLFSINHLSSQFLGEYYIQLSNSIGEGERNLCA